MQGPNVLLWLAWTGFAGYLGWLLIKQFLPAVRLAPPAPKEPATAPPAWLFCEDGAALDRKVQWFTVRPGGRTVVGARPRAATADTSYMYLTADDIREDHALVQFDPESGRYTVTCLGDGTVLHNNDPLNVGTTTELADGDTLDLGRISRFRFTLTGPESS